MIRLFETNKVRRRRELDGSWMFQVGEKDAPESDGMDMQVPGCWENHPKLLAYRGKGVYTKRLELEEKTNLRFVFKGVGHTARVWFDGRLIAEHYNAYTAFDAIVKDVASGVHELSIEADNSFHEASSLHIPNDYYSYGGITRPVVMEEIGQIYIERLQFTPRCEDGRWHATVEAIVHNVSEAPIAARLEGSLCGASLRFASAVVEPGKHTLRAVQALGKVQPWSHAQPELYLLKTALFLGEEEEPADDLIERVGFRVVTTEGGKLQVNGEDIVLKGFNRHEDHPAAGSALPVSLMAQDLDLMADMGANCVRTSHYPNDERFLDLCDERGLYVWEENHARGLSLQEMRHPLFISQCENVNREMVEQHVNHPSIITWGILNECASDSEEGREHYRRQLKQIRELDGSRPLTFASHHREKELCFDLADIVSVNLYPGWYTDEDPGELCDRARAWADAAGGAGKPMILSEFGGDGYYGYRDASRVRGTEERQADIIESNLAAYLARDYLSGMLIWQFCDCRVTEATGWLLSRAGTQNSKGIVDRYRRPKLAYDVVRTHFTAKQK
ncbi:glycoside hydrolase family 2 TIM barrel-domain containing protein [Paenibacillus sp. HB172176]|uniref:glycoside hydrolase family 2 protein n=1 Tax=Paenibacillus sp. HB172176 TaxID=2493690 RepID=UPI0014398116|nr:glycoside hydrolase family 2 TIM barrel-domain containing protein [Paenibacillus sp. HB172176]